MDGNYIFNICRLDYFNSLFIGLDQWVLQCLQLVQNAAASLLTGTKNCEHITTISLTPLALCPFQD